MKETPRTGETKPAPPRSKRIFKANGEFYFETRELTIMGPYTTEEEADQAIKDYIEFVQSGSDLSIQNFSRGRNK